MWRKERRHSVWLQKRRRNTRNTFFHDAADAEMLQSAERCLHLLDYEKAFDNARHGFENKDMRMIQ